MSLDKQQILLDIKQVKKTWGDNNVLKGVDLIIKKGQIHGLLGANGAGKSTFVKILTGLVQRDQGIIKLEETILDKNITPKTAITNGIILIPQEPLLFPNATVLQNIFLGLQDQDSSRATHEILEKLHEIIDSFGVQIDLNALASTLDVADQQLTQIFRGLMSDAKLLILDEPTSALTANEVQALFNFMNLMTEQGVSIIFISHRIYELYEICDYISVLCDGKIVLSGEINKYSEKDIINAMTCFEGYSSLSDDDMFDIKVETTQLPPVFETDQLTGEGFAEMTIQLYPGEIVGLTGVVGSGRTEFAESVIGLRRITSGSIKMFGKNIDLDKEHNPYKMQKNGLVYLPEDRRQHGLFLDASILWNMVSFITKDLPFVVNAKKEQAIGDKYREDLGIVCRSLSQRIGELSGGNQQKILFAKYLISNPKVFILDEPSRGVDIQTRLEIYQVIKKMARKWQIAILVISSDYEEVSQLCDRCLIMQQGYLIKKMSKKELNPKRIAECSWGNSATIFNE